MNGTTGFLSCILYLLYLLIHSLIERIIFFLLVQLLICKFFLNNEINLVHVKIWYNHDTQRIFLSISNMHDNCHSVELLFCSALNFLTLKMQCQVFLVNVCVSYYRRRHHHLFYNFCIDMFL